MKRKLVKHGPSSYIVSLPLSWIKKNKLSKGDEINVEEIDENVLISTSYKEKFEKAIFNIKDIKDLTTEVIHAMYARGIDEIRFNYDRQDECKLIMKAVAHEAIGFEIVETTNRSCTIRSITKLTREFDVVLRRLFLVTLSLGEEGLKAIKEKDFHSLSNIMFLEKSNNKLSTFCMRYINNYPIETYDKIAPLYSIVEKLEQIGDEYNSLFQNHKCFSSPKCEYSSSLIGCYSKINMMLRLFYECFYKYDYDKLRKIKKEKETISRFLRKQFHSLNSNIDITLYHHAMGLVEKVFSLISPYLVLTNHDKK